MKRLLIGACVFAVAGQLAGCLADQNGVQVTVTPSNFGAIVMADAQANCPAIQALANATQIIAPVAADLAGDPALGKTAATVASASTAVCNKVTGQLATGTTAVAPVRVTPVVVAPIVPAASSAPAAAPASGG